ncbi:protein kinase activating protein dpb11 [Ascochyta rabiei]|uniref:protein kinase activating protein dpb11 n=1 Tax=Didymella rabiei TaxID=5454 RepID=UPI002203F17A|nr:protein kinase activating protein dpb11 [Ascochyta rabiei]UPX15095.1 protein kinase activating protein dpb11 [Ascochyta rabiei]
MDATDGHYGTAHLPLTGAILCCTALPHEQRAQLSAIGAQMGATIKLDLTSDVTHLVAGNTDSAKYRYVAKLREDVKVLSPSWLEALRDVWMEGDDDMDVAGLEKQYRLPTFFGLKICLTGFDNPEQRKHIQDTVDQNGAEYHGDLTKNVTHLIAAAPTGKKYEHALNWRMKIVTLEWFHQSLDRGMVLEETLYNPTLPTEERGKDAWIRIQSPPPALGKRTRVAEQPQPLNPLRRKLRRAASTKLGIQSDAIWAGITTPSFDQGKIEQDEWREDNLFKQTTPHSDTPVQQEDTAVARAAEAEGISAPERAAAVLPQPPGLDPDEGIFHNLIVVTHGFDQDKTNILQNHLEKNGARVSSSTDLDRFSAEELKHGYLVIPHDVEVDAVSGSLPGRAGTITNLVTNWWVERCLYGKRLVDPTDDVLSRPFDKLSINGFSGLTVNSTGFSGIELLHVTKAVTLMGATYDEQLHAKTSVIVCNSRRPAPHKLKFATDRRIPAVHADWLWQCLHTGALQPFSNHLLNTLAPRQPQKTRPKPQLTEKPIVALPKEEGSKLQENPKKTNATRIVTKPQNSRARGPQIPRALDLAPSADATPASPTDPLTLPADSTRTSHAFDNNEALGDFDGNASAPLHDITANSPRRPSASSTGSATNGKDKRRQRSSSAESLIRAIPAARSSNPAREPTPDSVIPAPSEPPVQDPQPPVKGPEEEKDYSDLLTKLRATRKAAPTPADQADEKRRRRRQLGRATSTRSVGSAGDAGSGNLSLNGEDEDDETVVINEYQPSQELGWDSPGAAKAREAMIKKLGGTLKEKSVPVKAIGGAMDGPSESGMTSRAGRKRRPGI